MLHGTLAGEVCVVYKGVTYAYEGRYIMAPSVTWKSGKEPIGQAITWLSLMSTHPGVRIRYIGIGVDWSLLYLMSQVVDRAFRRWRSSY